MVLAFVATGIRGALRAALSFCVHLLVLGLVAVSGIGSAAAGPPSRMSSAELLTSITSFEALLEETRRRSLTYRVRGKLFVGDFGRPLLQWFLPRTYAGQPPLPASIWLNTIVFHAVCQENKRAIISLNWSNRNIWGGLFGFDEAEYLHRISRRHHVTSDFLASLGADKVPSFKDAKAAERYRRFKQALAAEDYAEARRLAGVFGALCRVRHR